MFDCVYPTRTAVSGLSAVLQNLWLGHLLVYWCYIFSIYSNVWKLSSSFMESFRGKNWPYSSLWEIHGHIFSFHLYDLAYACTLHLMSPQFESYFKQQGIEQIAFLIFLTFLIWIPLQRFGTALVPWGQLHLKNKQYATDFEPINRDCGCLTCKHYTRAYINCLLGREEVACHLLTLHNIYYQVSYRRLQISDSWTINKIKIILSGKRHKFAKIKKNACTNPTSFVFKILISLDPMYCEDFGRFHQRKSRKTQI